MALQITGIHQSIFISAWPMTCLNIYTVTEITHFSYIFDKEKLQKSKKYSLIWKMHEKTAKRPWKRLLVKWKKKSWHVVFHIVINTHVWNCMVRQHWYVLLQYYLSRSQMVFFFQIFWLIHMKKCDKSVEVANWLKCLLLCVKIVSKKLCKNMKIKPNDESHYIAEESGSLCIRAYSSLDCFGT